MKICCHCKNEKPLSKFGKNTREEGSKSRVCKDCIKERMKKKVSVAEGCYDVDADYGFLNEEYTPPMNNLKVISTHKRK